LYVYFNRAFDMTCVVARAYAEMRRDPSLGGSNNAPTRANLARVLAAMRLDRDSVLVDAGCGFGMPSIIAAATYGCRCYGVDHLPGMVDRARAAARRAGVDHLCTFDLVDLADLDPAWLAERRVTHAYSFDAVIAPAAWNAMRDAVCRAGVECVASCFGPAYWPGRSVEKVRIRMVSSGEGRTMHVMHAMHAGLSAVV
jgi:cyclopropane fatty-acyl-phospholipid synthase-like methyltransferase